jgi:alanyl-tRNA synthetase
VSEGTTRLYYSDAYRTDFTSRVVGRSEDGLRVYLAETAFYPTSGGQPHDVGRLGAARVVDVVDEEGDRIAHVLASPADRDATELEGTVDWTHRFDNMQQHSGQHLLSAVFEDLFGFKTVSVHFGADSSTLDVDAESISHQQLVACEARANAIVAEARPVGVTFEDAADAARSGLRKASDRDGTLRIVSIDGVDRSACGGTHVRSTAEIGAMLVRSTERVRRATRVEFLCGSRAIARARRDFESLDRIASSLSAASGDVAALVSAQAERLKDSETARRKLEKELAVFRTKSLFDAAEPNTMGVRTIVIRDATSADELRGMAQAAFALPRVVVVGALTNPPSVLLASSEDSGVDAGRVLKDRLAKAGGRGGGSARIAQGSVPDVQTLDAVVAALVSPAPPG